MSGKVCIEASPVGEDLVTTCAWAGEVSTSLVDSCNMATHVVSAGECLRATRPGASNWSSMLVSRLPMLGVCRRTR